MASSPTGKESFFSRMRGRSMTQEDTTPLLSKQSVPPPSELFSLETTPPMQAPALCGYLQKENRKQRYQKRFFKANNQFLFYAKTRADAATTTNAQIKAWIDLRKTSTICLLVRGGGDEDESTSRRFAIQTTDEANNELCFLLKAKTPQSAQNWVNALNKRRDYWLGGADERNLASKDQSSDEEFFSCEEEEAEEKVSRYQRAQSMRSSLGDDHSYSSLLRDVDDNDSEEGEDAGAMSFPPNNSMVELEADRDFVQQFTRKPYSPWNARFWQRASAAHLRVRGPNYLRTFQKIPCASKPLFELICVDMFHTGDRRVDHIASHPQNRVHQMLQQAEANTPFLFIFHVQIPGPPFLSFVAYFAARHVEVQALLNGDLSSSTGEESQFPPGMKSLLLQFFRTGSDAFCDAHFKLIPRVEEGPLVVRAGVPSRPALIGTKLRNSYYRHDRYFEIDVNTGSNAFAAGITQLALNFCKLVTVDLGMVIEGKEEDQLPEFLLAFCRVVKADVSKAVPW